MTTPLSLKGVAFGSFWPNPAATYPDFSTAGDIVPGYIDGQGNIAIRGPVTTDEGGFRDGFGDAGISADWVKTEIGGGTVTMTATAGNKNPLFTIPAGSAATARAYMTRPIDYLPIAVNIYLVNYTRRNNANFFIGLYSSADIDAAIASGSYCEWLFLGTGAAGVADFAAQYDPGKIQTAAGVTVTSTGTAGFRSILLDGEGVTFRDNTIVLPTTSARQTFSVASQGLYTKLYLGIGYRCSGAIGGAAATTEIGAAFVKNMNRLVVNTAF